MDQIKELGNIVQHEKEEQYKELIQNNSKKSMLFRVIMESLVSNDRDASLLIYGKVDEGKKYQMLKRNLKEKLIEILNSKTDNAHFKLAQIQVECNEKLMLAANLLANNVFHNAEKLLNGVIRKAEKYFLYDILKDAAILYRNVSSIKGYPEQVIEWNKKIDKYSQCSGYHNTAKGVVQLFNSHFIHNCSLLKEYVELAESNIALLEEQIKEGKSVVLELYKKQLLLYKHLHNNNFHQVSVENKNLEALILENSFLNTEILSFHIKLNVAKVLMVSGEINEARKVVEECLKISDYKSFLKFEAQALYFSILIKEEEYENAGELLIDVFATYEFGLFYPEAKAAWYIRKALLYFILYSKQDIPSIKKYTTEFTTSALITFLDENCKKLSKDKLGYNIQYLIIRLLLTWQNTSEGTYYIGKNLQLYYYRNLKEIKELRVKYFLKSLSSIAINEFNKTDISEHSNKFALIIKEQKYANRYDMNEVIPFEKIFEILLQDNQI